MPDRGSGPNAAPGVLQAAYEEEGILGRGAFGVVLRARRREDGLQCACKRIALGPLSESLRKKALQEARLLRELESPFVVRYLDSFLDSEDLCIVTELCEGGTLAGLLARQGPGSGSGLAEDLVVRYAVQVLLGLAYLHSRRILHRDVKPANVFLPRNGVALLGDLGVAKVLLSTLEQAHTVVGSPAYMAPELVDAKPYGAASDIWALGCVAFEMCALRRPFEAPCVPALCVKIVQGRIPNLPSRYSAPLKAVIARCFTRLPSQRPSAVKLLRTNPFREVGARLGAEVPCPSASPPPSSRPASKGLQGGLASGSRPSALSRSPSTHRRATAPSARSKSPSTRGGEPHSKVPGRSNSAGNLLEPGLESRQHCARKPCSTARPSSPVWERPADSCSEETEREKLGSATGRRRIAEASAAVARLEAARPLLGTGQDLIAGEVNKPARERRFLEGLACPESASTCGSGSSSVASLDCSVFAGSELERSASEPLMERCERHLLRAGGPSPLECRIPPGCELEVTLLPDSPSVGKAQEGHDFENKEKATTSADESVRPSSSSQEPRSASPPPTSCELDSLALSCSTLASSQAPTLAWTSLRRSSAGKAFAAACAGARVKSGSEGELLECDVVPELLEATRSTQLAQSLSRAAQVVPAERSSAASAWEVSLGVPKVGSPDAGLGVGTFGMSLGAVCSLLAGEAAIRNGVEEQAARRASRHGSLSSDSSSGELWNGTSRGERRSSWADLGLEAVQTPRWGAVGERWSSVQDAAAGIEPAETLTPATSSRPTRQLSSRFLMAPPEEMSFRAEVNGEHGSHSARASASEGAAMPESAAKAIRSSINSARTGTSRPSRSQTRLGQAGSSPTGRWSSERSSLPCMGQVSGSWRQSRSPPSASRVLGAGRASCPAVPVAGAATAAAVAAAVAEVEGLERPNSDEVYPGASSDAPHQDTGRDARECPGLDAELRRSISGTPLELEKLGGGRYRLAGRRVFCRLDEKGHPVARCGAKFVPIGQFLASVSAAAS